MVVVGTTTRGVSAEPQTPKTLYSLNKYFHILPDITKFTLNSIVIVLAQVLVYDVAFLHMAHEKLARTHRTIYVHYVCISMSALCYETDGAK